MCCGVFALPIIRLERWLYTECAAALKITRAALDKPSWSEKAQRTAADILPQAGSADGVDATLVREQRHRRSGRNTRRDWALVPLRRDMRPDSPGR